MGTTTRRSFEDIIGVLVHGIVLLSCWGLIEYTEVIIVRCEIWIMI
jgi:hypothetical protein